MRHIVNADPKKIFSFTLGDAGRRQLAHVCEDYTATQLERGFASLDYWKKVKD
jgi:DNA repair protein RecO (recombination protein O)